jgi:hypothetical protein
VELQLGARLGCGGSSDVYHLDSSSSSSSSVRAESTVKVARFATEYVLTSYEAERRSLAALAVDSAPGEGLVPQCLSFGARKRRGGSVPAAVLQARRVGRAMPWPVLLLHPRGQPLEQWVAARVSLAAAAAVPGAEEATGAAGGGASAADAAAAARERLACADAVLPRLLRALAAAHAVGWVHCDVRPSNIVVAAQGVMLWWTGARQRALARRRGRVCQPSAPGRWPPPRRPWPTPPLTAAGRCTRGWQWRMGARAWRPGCPATPLPLMQPCWRRGRSGWQGWSTLRRAWRAWRLP